MSWEYKFVMVKGKKAGISSVSPSSNCSDKGLMLETSALLPFTVANLCSQLSCYH